MVFTSAYRRYFKKPTWDDFGVHEWERKLQYRSDRRSLEHRHEPWLWDSETDDQEDIEEVDPPSFNRGLQPRNEQRVPKLAWNGNQEATEVERSKGKQVKNEKEAPKDLEGKSKHQGKHIDSLSKLDRAERQRRQRRSVERKFKKHLHSSETSSKRAKNEDKSKHKSPPFLPYGWANKGVPVENMKTYNVFASPTEVYPAALRAAKRREADIKTKSKQYEEALRKKEIRPNIEDSYPTYPKSMWLTEYQRNFCRPVNQKLNI